MNEPVALNQIDAIAAAALSALDRCKQIEPFSKTRPSFDLDQAYAVTARLRGLRTARGERPVGRKIGFTNRTIWPEYGVYAPIWGDMYDSTVQDLPADEAAFSIAHLPEPRIEPEIAFKFSAAPKPGMDEAAILGCVEWIAHGFEIVQSIYPGWRFSASDTVADFALHGAFLIGPKVRIAAEARADWLAKLSTFEIVLFQDGMQIDRGQAHNVLDGPLSALRHLIALLATDPHNSPIAAGEIITTGTVTRAFPIKPGENWRTEVVGLPLAGIGVRFA